MPKWWRPAAKARRREAREARREASDAHAPPPVVADALASDAAYVRLPVTGPEARFNDQWVCTTGGAFPAVVESRHWPPRSARARVIDGLMEEYGVTRERAEAIADDVQAQVDRPRDPIVPVGRNIKLRRE